MAPALRGMAKDDNLRRRARQLDVGRPNDRARDLIDILLVSRLLESRDASRTEQMCG